MTVVFKIYIIVESFDSRMRLPIINNQYVVLMVYYVVYFNYVTQNRTVVLLFEHMISYRAQVMKRTRNPEHEPFVHAKSGARVLKPCQLELPVRAGDRGADDIQNQICVSLN